jgi:glycosyltransferase involved in cell wall biosynthesis
MVLAQRDRKKVLFFIPSLEGGGAERFFSLIVRHLDRTRFEPHLALLQAKGEYLRDIPADVIVHVLDRSRIRYALLRFVRLVWSLRPETIFSTLGHVNVLLTFSKPFLPRGTKLLIQQAVFTSEYIRETARHPYLWFWLCRRFFRRADRVLCLCESMVSDMVEHFGLSREKLSSIYYPVDVERVRSMAKQGENPYSGPGPHLVAAGRLVRQKGFDILLDAMPAVLSRLPMAQLTILGQGPLRRELGEQAQSLGIVANVSFAGFQQNPWRYINHATIFVMPSRYEGLPNMLLETLVLGRSVVASDCPGAVREAQNCGVDVTLVPPESPAALAEAIISACVKPQRPADANTSQLAAERFGLGRILEEYASIL